MKFNCFLIVAAFLTFTMATARTAYGTPLLDACSLLTPSQVSAAAGTSIGAGTPLYPTDTKVCQWRATGAAAKIRVQLFLKDPRTFAYTKMLTQGMTNVTASGIGDDAIYSTSPGSPSILTVKKGDVVFAVHVLCYGLADDKVKAMEKTLALNVLAKL